MLGCLRFSSCSLRRWSQLMTTQPDPILEPDRVCKEDPNPNKINLTVGAYKDGKGNPYILRSVKKAERMIMEENINKEYPPLSGIPEFCKEAAVLGFGKDSDIIRNSLNCTIQSVSGAGGVRLAAEFLMMNWHGNKEIWISDLTWPSHNEIISAIGMNIKNYRYYDYQKKGLNFEGMMEDFENIPEKSIVLLHPCGHNPTGVDPSIEQWKSISDVLSRRKCCIFFDMAYQGFTSGDLDFDASSVRLFSNNVSLKDCPLVLVQSFSKNMGLYGERVGTVSVVCESQEEREQVKSILALIARRMTSFSPIHGARIASKILSNPQLRNEWIIELKGMADRIKQMRKLVVRKLEERGSSRDWSHFEKQNGMFCYTGLTTEEVQSLRNKHSVYLIKTGRLSVSGLNNDNIDYFVNALHDVTK